MISGQSNPGIPENFLLELAFPFPGSGTFPSSIEYVYYKE